MAAFQYDYCPIHSKGKVQRTIVVEYSTFHLVITFILLYFTHWEHVSFASLYNVPLMKYYNTFAFMFSVTPLLGMKTYLNVDLKMMNFNDVVSVQTEVVGKDTICNYFCLCTSNSLCIFL